MFRMETKSFSTRLMGSALAKWVIARHNLINNQPQDSAFDEAAIQKIEAQEAELRKILIESGEAGALNEVMNEAIAELHRNADQLHTLSDEELRSMENVHWSPNEEGLPEVYDITVGSGSNRQRYVSLNKDQWAKIPLESTEEFIAKLRQKIAEKTAGTAESNGESSQTALLQAIYCLYEGVLTHLGRFVMGIGTNHETPHWSVSNTPLVHAEGKATTHELVGIVASGDVIAAKFLDKQFSRIMAQHCDAEEQNVRLVGTIELPNAINLVRNTQAIRDLSWAVGKRLSEGQVPMEFHDKIIFETRHHLGIQDAEGQDTEENHTLLVFSVVRNPTEQRALFGVTMDNPESAQDQAWIESITEWSNRIGMPNTYVLPPAPLLESIGRLGAAHVAALGQEDTIKTAAGLEKPGALGFMEPIDVIGFNQENIPIARTQLPAWLFGLLEESLAKELDELFNIDLEVLPPSHGLDLNDIPSIDEDTTHQATQPRFSSSKHTLH